MTRKYTSFLITFLVCLFIDQLTKALTIAYLDVGEQYIVIDGWFSFMHAQNFGAAFSSLEGQFWIFIVFTVIATFVVGDLVRRMRPDATFTAMTLGMVLSGAWGNCIDRLRIGHVTDFLRVYTEHPGLEPWFVERFGTATWPIFNIADSALLVGMSIFLVHFLFLEDTVEDGELDDDSMTERPELD